ncbi:MAG: CD225/dispanin family protein [Muribaculaceae bacterium]
MKIWVILNGVQQGPYNEAQLPELPLKPDTPVWYEGLPQWTLAAEAPATAALFGRADAGHTHEAETPQPQPQPQPQHQASAVPIDEPCPKTFMAWSIVLTICCCTPVSVAAIFTSAFVSRNYRNGDLRGARRMSEVTEWLVIIAIVMGVITAPLWWSIVL